MNTIPRNSIPTILALLAAALLGTTADAQKILTVKKDGTGDHTSIQAALDDGSGAGEIVVYPGCYEENIVIGRSVILRAKEGPYLTCIDGHSSGGNCLSVLEGIGGVRVTGFTVTRGKYGVYVGVDAHVILSNCVIIANTLMGIYGDSREQANTYLELYNNVIRDNGDSGIWINIYFSGDTYMFYLRAYNNILIDNQTYNIAHQTYTRHHYPERFAFDYNTMINTVGQNYGGSIGPGEVYAIGEHNNNYTPQFVGQTGGPGFDARLQDGATAEERSPLIDAGMEGPAWQDPDGSRNDIGAYGGPYAATFFESPLDGPIVRSVRTEPGSVPQGAAFSVVADVAVR